MDKDADSNIEFVPLNAVMYAEDVDYSDDDDYEEHEADEVDESKVV